MAPTNNEFMFTERLQSAKRARKQQIVVVGVCEGGGVRVAAALDDRNQAILGVVPNILTVRRKNALTEEQEQQCDRSVFCDKFEGFQHSNKLQIEGFKLGIYSYKYKGNKTAIEVHRYLSNAKIMRFNPNEPYEGDNVRVPVILAGNGDLLPMNAFFSEKDILELSIGNDWHAKNFQRDYSPLEQDKSFFWGDAADDHADLIDMVAAARASFAETDDF